MLIIMNALDGAMTIFWVTTAQAVESNPLMALILEVHPAFFMALKCALVSLGALLLWRHRENNFALLSLGAMCAVYGGVLTHHWRMLVSLLA